MFNEIRNHVYFLYHYILCSTKTAHRDETLMDGGFSTEALFKSLFGFLILDLLFTI